MATKTPVPTPIKSFGENSTHVVWENITLVADVCTPVEMSGSSIRSVQMSGTWDGGTLLLEGSNDGVTYFTLTDPQGNSISKTADALEQVEEVTRYIRPRCTVAGASTDLDVHMIFVRRGQ